MSQQCRETPLPNLSEYGRIEPQPELCQLAEHVCQILPERRWQKKLVMQINIEVFQRFSKRLLEKVSQQGAPEQRNSAGPICVREALDGSELNETVTSAGRIPEFVKARFASMRVSGNIGMKVPEDFMDLQTAIAGR